MLWLTASLICLGFLRPSIKNNNNNWEDLRPSREDPQHEYRNRNTNQIISLEHYWQIITPIMGICPLSRSLVGIWRMLCILISTPAAQTIALCVTRRGGTCVGYSNSIFQTISKRSSTDSLRSSKALDPYNKPILDQVSS